MRSRGVDVGTGVRGGGEHFLTSFTNLQAEQRPKTSTDQGVAKAKPRCSARSPSSDADVSNAVALNESIIS
jgi:hypothetical protein